MDTEYGKVRTRRAGTARAGPFLQPANHAARAPPKGVKREFEGGPDDLDGSTRKRARVDVDMTLSAGPEAGKDSKERGESAAAPPAEGWAAAGSASDGPDAAGDGSDGGRVENEDGKLYSKYPPGSYFMGVSTEAKPTHPVGKGTGLVYDDRMCMHYSTTDSDHPECPLRVKAIYQKLVDDGLAQRCVPVTAREATKQELLTVHSEAYRQVVVSTGKLRKPALETLETMYDSIYLNDKSGESARVSAGATVEMVTRVVQGQLRNGVAIVRPPGHHAERHQSKGFCLFNNVAIAAKVAVEKLGVKRVFVIDWDIHHGNGTQHMFEDDKRVFYFSAHRYDHGTFYPASPDGDPRKVGVEPARGYNMNVGWNSSGIGDGDYLGLWHQLLLPAAYEFAPELVLISAGFDSARGDPLGGCDISPTGFAHLTHSLMALAQGKCVLILEGGYNLSAISHSFAACTKILLGDPPPLLPSAHPRAPALRAIRSTKNAHAPYWTCCSEARTTDEFRYPKYFGSSNNGLGKDDEDEDDDEDDDDEDFVPDDDGSRAASVSVEPLQPVSTETVLQQERRDGDLVAAQGGEEGKVPSAEAQEDGQSGSGENASSRVVGASI